MTSVKTFLEKNTRNIFRKIENISWNIQKVLIISLTSCSAKCINIKIQFIATSMSWKIISCEHLCVYVQHTYICTNHTMMCMKIYSQLDISSHSSSLSITKLFSRLNFSVIYSLWCFQCLILFFLCKFRKINIMRNYGNVACVCVWSFKANNVVNVVKYRYY